MRRAAVRGVLRALSLAWQADSYEAAGLPDMHDDRLHAARSWVPGYSS